MDGSNIINGTPSPPNDERKHPNLLIQVPGDSFESSFGNESMFNASFDSSDSPTGKLGDAMSIRKQFSPTQHDFDSITQLPTPIMNNGSFGSFSPVENSILDIQKLRRKSSLNRQVGKDRTISEYRPIEKKMPEKRVSSFNIPTDAAIPSPPIDENLTSIYEHQQFYSAKYDRNFRFCKVIGKGNFSNVVLVEDVNDINTQIAIKIIRIPLKNKNQIKNFKNFLKRELNILFQLDHPHVIKLLDYNINLEIDRAEIELVDGIDDESDPDDQFDTSVTTQDAESLNEDNRQLIFLNYCPGGNLFEFSSQKFRGHNKQLVYWLNIRQIVKELMWSVDYIHKKMIIHRDIKLENVLLNFSGEQLVSNPYNSICCLTDFGLAKKLSTPDQLLTTRCGSQDYIAPEILMGLSYNGFLTDSWAVGVLVYCLLEDRLPFDLPSYNYLAQSGISPSVIKRRMTKNTPAHRIAMIDWDWYLVSDLLNEELDQNIKLIINQLKTVVEAFLVRKDRRKTVSELLGTEQFQWLTEPGVL